MAVWHIGRIEQLLAGWPLRHVSAASATATRPKLKRCNRTACNAQSVVGPLRLDFAPLGNSPIVVCKIGGECVSTRPIGHEKKVIRAIGV